MRRLEERESLEIRKKEILKTYFGYETFRAGQEKIIDCILAGQDVLAVMPTGAGKSLCYQLPALLMRGITVVVSPLISLMTDQVKALNEMGVHAAYINSSLTEGQIAKALEFARAGRYKMIYVAPERLETPRFLDFANHAEISMITVDEAHCISQWGQDFRPSYVRILSFIRQLPRRPVVSAFTATATRRVREDILASLALENPCETVTGFDRENLYFEVQRTKNKKERIRKYLGSHEGDSGIIYCATRKGVDELYQFLTEEGFQAGRYHAGMDQGERSRSQEDFIYDRIKVMIATNAFGMGIDKSNVRYVLHYNMPQSMENYYQEAGRAGRDGEPAECILYYSPQDTMINRFLLESKERDGEYSWEEMRIIQAQDMERLHKMEAYCTTAKCLRGCILNYFGEEAKEKCGNCSNCLEEFQETDVSQAAADVIRCVQASGQRFGMNMIAGTLLGENTAKIRSYHMEENPVYGKQSKLGQSLLKEIIRAMVEQGYLRQTEDKYSLLKLTGQSGRLLEGEDSLRILLRKEDAQENSRKNTETVLTQKGNQLFEELRKLRAELAKERSLPPYMVASDKTLRDMCLRIPLTEEEMLAVNGMGKRKLEQYGAQFLKRILAVTGGDWESWGADPELRKSIPGDGGKSSEGKMPLTESRQRGKKAEFRLTEELLSGIQYVPELSVSEFTAQINERRDEKRMKRLTIKWLTEKLLEEGCLEKRADGGYEKIVLTRQGAAAGFRAEERVSARGMTYEVFFCTEVGQRHLVEMMKKEWM